MSERMLFAALLIAMIVELAQAQSCPFTITSDADFIDPTCTHVSGDIWDIDIYIEHSGSATLTIIANDTAGGNDPFINNLNIRVVQTGGGSPPNISCIVRGPNLSPLNLAGLDSLTIDSMNEGIIDLQWLVVGGDVGTIECHNATKLSGDDAETSGIFIAGDVTGGFIVRESPGISFFPDRIDEIQVGGDYLGDLTSDGQECTISNVSVAGDIGTLTAPSTFYLGGQGVAGFGTIACDNMYADVGALGPIRRIETQGVLVGDIECIYLEIFQAGLGSGDPGIFIGSGDLTGAIIVWSGANRFLGDIEIPGSVARSGSISVGEVAADWTISIGGDLLGTLATGALSGTIEIGGLVDAPISVGGAFSSADLAGSIILNGTLNSDLLIFGDLTGSLVIAEDVTKGAIAVSGDLTSSGLIQIDGVVDSGIRISGSAIGDIEVGVLDGDLVSIGDDLQGDILIGSAAGLGSQIVINANHNGGQWLGDVVVGTTVLGPGESMPYLAPYYEALSTTLGGGAIGLVPFMFHAVESVPEHGSTVFTIPTSVTIAHYGPIADGDGQLDPEEETPPVRVYRASLLTSPGNPPPDIEGTEVCDGLWTEVTDNYAYSVSGRTLTITGTFTGWRAYQVVPNDLICDIADEPAVVYAQGWEGANGCGGTESYGYGFRIQPGFDMNMNGFVESGDVETWLATPADLDADDDADNTDLLMLVGAVTSGGE